MKDNICRSCGTVCPAEFKFCPFCGASLQAGKCAVCGEELIDGAKFCVNCGARVDVSQGAAAEAVKIQETAQAIEGNVSENSADNATENSAEAAEGSVAAEPQKTAETQKAAEESCARPAVWTNAHEMSSAPKKTDAAKKKYIVRVIKNSVVFALCIILFALSFCGVVTVKVDKEIISGIIGEEFEIDGLEITAVDVIDLMGATANPDNPEYEDEMIELAASLGEALKNDYNDRLGKYILSSRTKEIIADVQICALKYMINSSSSQGGPVYNNIIIAGVLCLINMLFSFAMLIVGAISFFSVLFRQKNKVSKFLYALPVYLFVSMMILFIVKTTFGVGTAVAGAMGTALFFGVAALIVAVLFVVFAGKSKPIKNAIPKFVSLGVSLIVCACMFAPVMTAKYDLVLQNKRTQDTYSVSVDASGLITYLAPEIVEECESNPDITYENYMAMIEEGLDAMTEMTSYEFKTQAGEMMTGILLEFITVAIGEYSLTGALSFGYYALIVVFMLFASFAVATVATLHEKNDKFYPLLITAIVFIVIALACSIGWICVLNYNLEDLALSFTVGGGLIAGILVAIVGMITSSVLMHVFRRPAKPVIDADYAAEE